MNERSIFMAALEQGTPAQRTAFLDQACASDAALRQRVDALLASHEQAGSFLGKPVPERFAQASPTIDEPVLATLDEPTEGAGTVIRPYKLLQQIGEGGMGTVFMAEQQEPVKRCVALKIIKPGLDSKQVLARFEAERQALALMDHPNIAKVFDAGATASGRPYFVMELIKGIPITRYCDQRRLTLKERLELFVPVCQAVQHAHQKGIIHRDVKPSNVLMAQYDGRPVPKVIDFGIVKATGPKLSEATAFTEFGQVVGTLEYMSPEQAELNQLDIDTRSDIYSLGVLLYELLTGSTPLDRQRLKQAGILELLRLVREEEAPKPSTRLSTTEELPSVAANRGLEPKKLSGLVRGELDWIVMKALEKDRNRRYETANGLALDVQRYLANEPVQACPPSAWYRLRKLARRHRGPAVAGSVILLCLVAGIIGTSAALVWAVRERDNKGRALAAEIQEREAKERALAAETRALKTAERAHEKALVALRDLTDEIVEKQMARGVRLTDENKAFLRQIIKHFEGLAADTADDAESRATRAEGYVRVGIMRSRLGEQKEAEAALRTGLALRQQLVADFSNRPEFRGDLARAHDSLGTLLAANGRYPEAETAFRAALALWKQLFAELPTELVIRQDLADSHYNLGKLLSTTGRPREAEKAYAAAIALLKGLPADSLALPDVRSNLAKIYHDLGHLLYDTGRPKEGEKRLRAALALLKKLVADFSDRPQYRQNQALGQNNLGIMLRNMGRPKEAETAFRAALALRKQLAADFPTRPEFLDELAVSHNTLAYLLRATGRLPEAEAECTAALVILKQLVADFPTRPEFRQDLALGHSRLGSLLLGTGRPKEAEMAIRAALVLRKQLVADFPTRPEFRDDLAHTHNTLGQLLHVTGRTREAETAFRAALVINQKLVDDFPTHLEYRRGLASNYANLGIELMNLGRLQEAETAFRAALTTYKELPADYLTRPEIRQNLAGLHGNLASLLEDTGRLREAETDFVAAIALNRQLATDFSHQPDLQNELAGAFGNLGMFYLRQRDFNAAKAQLLEAVPHHEAALKAQPRDPTYQKCYRNNLVALMQTYAGLGEQAMAKQTAEKLRDLGWAPSADAYDAACSLALCIPIVQKNDRASPAERAKQAAFYGDEAMKMLRDAIAKGFKDAAHVKKDTDLAPLRGREDFKKLLAELEARTKQSGSRGQKGEKKPQPN